MKASHRKDVIIARLIFAAICLFLIALIATIVITVTSKGGKKKEQDKVQQNAVSESETDSAGDSDTEIGANICHSRLQRVPKKLTSPLQAV